MHFYTLANIAALLPLLLTLPVSVIAQTSPIPSSANCSPVMRADTSAAILANFQKQAAAKSWQNARLVHTIPVQDTTSNGLFGLSPDGQTIATGNYQLETSNDGRTLTGKTVNTIKLWNLNTGELSRTMSYKSPSEVKAIAFSPNGQMLATSTYQDALTIKFWNVRTGEKIQTFRSVVKPKINRGVGFDISQNSQIAFSPDGKSLISITGGNSTVQVWDVGQLRAECNANKQIQSKEIQVRSPQFNTPQAIIKNTLATQKITSPIRVVADKIPQQYQAQLEQAIAEEQSRYQAQLESAVAADQNRHTDDVFIDQDAIKNWLDTGDNFESIQNKLKQQSRLVQFWKKTETPAIYQAKTNFYVDDLTRRIAREYVFLKARTILDELGTDTTDGGQSFTGQGFSISNQGNNWIITATQGNRAILRLKDGQYEPNLFPSFPDITNIRSATQKLLNQGSLRANLIGHKDEITAYAFSPDNQFLVSGSADRTIKLWNLKTGKLIRTLQGNNQTINSLVISPDSQIITSNGLNNNTIKLWNLKTGTLTRSLVNRGEVRTIRFSPNGKNLVDISLIPNSIDTQIQIREVKTGKLIHQSPQFNWRAGLALSPDGKTYAIAGIATTFQVSDLMTDKAIKTFPNVEEQGVVFTPDGKSLVTLSGGEIKIWQ